ncbi:hypothetical protein [Jannaschia seosinensis]|uniref:hypothetical protein n=1 Tax=Jannaschia seosinensis TaxID=313367 RepID=UPI000A5B4B8E|nr:hypothetical protein [Jannaschia seosinensis]
MARASYAASARAMALGALSLAWFCAAAWPVFTPPLTFDEKKSGNEAVDGFCYPS